MSSAENLRSFINERLTTAAEEIFGVFHKVIVEYEEVIDRQSRLLDKAWNPDIKLHRIELPQQHVYEEEEVLTHQQLSNQEGNSSLDQEDSEPPQIKEEQEDLFSQEEEQLCQQESTFMLIPVSVENDHSEDQTLDLNPDETLEESAVNMQVKNLSEPNSDLQLFSNDCHGAENQDQKGGKHEDSGSARSTECEAVPVSLIEDLQSVGVLAKGVSVYNCPYKIFPPPLSCAPLPNTQHSKKKKYGRQQADEGPYIKKPPNAFMLFLREQRPKVEPEIKEKGSGAVNAVLGQRWKSLTKEQQARYYDQADQERLLHEKLHPGWSNTENYGKKRKRCRGRASTSTASFPHFTQPADHKEWLPPIDGV